MTGVAFSALTTRGVKPINDDRAAVPNMVISSGGIGSSAEAPCVFAVMDGVSFGGQGGLAAQISAEAFLALGKGGDACEITETSIESVATSVQVALDSLKRARKLDKTSACTASGVYLGRDGRVLVFNVGDSRVYRLRSGILVQLTKDHTLVRQMEDAGAPEELILEALETDAHTITRALGMAAPPKRLMDITRGVAVGGDTYLVCTDGLMGAVRDEDIERLLIQLPDGDAAESLVRAAMASGADDNITAIVIRILD